MVKLSSKKIKHLLRQMDTGHDMTKKGRLLEELGCYLFRNIPGVSIHARNEYDFFNSQEVDLGFWNDQRQNGLPFLPNIIFVECKNWLDRVASLEVSHFIQKLQSKGLEFGVLFARNGITGNHTELTNAHLTIAQALPNHIKLIVITAKDIENITDTKQIIDLIIQKLCNLVISVKVN